MFHFQQHNVLVSLFLGKLYEDHKCSLDLAGLSDLCYLTLAFFDRIIDALMS